MTDPDPRTDLAGYLGLTEEQARWCHKAPVDTVAAAVGARLIEQDQARADEPDDGLHAMLDIDALGGAKHLRETMCVAQTAVGNFYTAPVIPSGTMETLQAICDVCDQHRPLGPDGKHGTGRCTPTCGCIDKRDTEPFDVWCPDDCCVDASSFRSVMVETRPGFWECPQCGTTSNEATDVIEPAPDDGLPEGAFRATVDVIVMPTGSVYAPWVVTRGGFEITGEWCDADHLREVFGITPPKPPWTSPLPNLPDLTEEQCRDAYDATMADPDMPYLKGVIGRALIAAGWTPEEEA